MLGVDKIIYIYACMRGQYYFIFIAYNLLHETWNLKPRRLVLLTSVDCRGKSIPCTAQLVQIKTKTLKLITFYVPNKLFYIF
jgi:hypothetical protein